MFRDLVVGQCAQSREVVPAIHGGDDDSLLAAAYQFRVHHDAGDSTVAIRERMDLAHEEQEEHCPPEGRVEVAV